MLCSVWLLFPTHSSSSIASRPAVSAPGARAATSMTTRSMAEGSRTCRSNWPSPPSTVSDESCAAGSRLPPASRQYPKWSSRRWRVAPRRRCSGPRRPPGPADAANRAVRTTPESAASRRATETRSPVAVPASRRRRTAPAPSRKPALRGHVARPFVRPRPAATLASNRTATSSPGVQRRTPPPSMRCSASGSRESRTGNGAAPRARRAKVGAGYETRSQRRRTNCR